MPKWKPGNFLFHQPREDITVVAKLSMLPVTISVKSQAIMLRSGDVDKPKSVHRHPGEQESQDSDDQQTYPIKIKKIPSHDRKLPMTNNGQCNEGYCKSNRDSKKEKILKPMVFAISEIRKIRKGDEQDTRQDTNKR